MCSSLGIGRGDSCATKTPLSSAEPHLKSQSLHAERGGKERGRLVSKQRCCLPHSEGAPRGLTLLWPVLPVLGAISRALQVPPGSSYLPKRSPPAPRNPGHTAGAHQQLSCPAKGA